MSIYIDQYAINWMYLFSIHHIGPFHTLATFRAHWNDPTSAASCIFSEPPPESWTSISAIFSNISIWTWLGRSTAQIKKCQLLGLLTFYYIVSNDCLTYAWKIVRKFDWEYLVVHIPFRVVTKECLYMGNKKKFI